MKEITNELLFKKFEILNCFKYVAFGSLFGKPYFFGKKSFWHF